MATMLDSIEKPNAEAKTTAAPQTHCLSEVSLIGYTLLGRIINCEAGEIMNDKDEKVREGLSETELEEESPLKYSITSYGADYPVDGLVRRIGDGSIFIPTFQRGFIWSLREASRFIESLLLGLPVPGIFLSRDEDTKKLMVIDGQQRLRTLQYFYDGIFHNTGREFALVYIGCVP